MKVTRSFLPAVAAALLVVTLLSPVVDQTAAATGAVATAASAPADGGGRALAAGRAAPALDPDEYQPMNPVRLLDTRRGIGAPTGTVGPRETITLQVTGREGIPSTGVGAVVMNITTTEATEVSFITAWPAGQPRPNASNVNTDLGTNTPNLAVVKLSAGGRVSLYNNSGEVHLVADVTGWFPTAATYTPLTPARVLDTRNATGGTQGPVGADTTIGLKVTGVGGVPETGVGSVVLNVTSTEATAQSYVTVWPHGDERPYASNLNTEPGVNTPNLTFVGVGEGGVVDLYNEAGQGHLVADVLGWFPTESNYRPSVPQRVLDTRRGIGVPAGLFGPTDTKTLEVPDEPVAAVVMNLTSTAASEESFLTAWPAGDPRNLTSNLNTDPGQNTPNLAIVMLGADGDLSFYNNSGTGHLVGDVLGWFPIGSTYVEVSEPGFEAKAEIPSTTKETGLLTSAGRGVSPTGPAVTMYVAAPGEDTYAVDDILELQPSTRLPGGFLGQITAAGPPDAQGLQEVVAVPGTLEVNLLLDAGAPRFQVDDHAIVDADDPALPDGYLGRVVRVTDLGGGVQLLDTVPGRPEEAFLQLDIEVDLAEAAAGGVVEDLGPAATLADPRVSGTIPLKTWDLSPSTLRKDLAGLFGLPGSCGLTGLDIEVAADLGYLLDLEWQWTLLWGFLPVADDLLVTAALTPMVSASIGMDSVGVDCEFTFPVVEFGFDIKFISVISIWAGPVISLEAGVSGFDFEATAEGGATVGLVANRWVFQPHYDADENITDLVESLREDEFDPNVLQPYVMADVQLAAGADLFGKTIVGAGVGPFTEVGFSMRSDRPLWAVDLGLASKLIAGGEEFTQELDVFDEPACSTQAPYDEPTQPCLVPAPSERVNGDDDDRDFAPRLRWSAATALNPMVIETTSLPEAVVDEPYQATLTTSGRYPATDWALWSGSLPSGLTLDPATGVISGTPTADGRWDLTVVAHDKFGGPIPNPTAPLSIVVHGRPQITTGPIIVSRGNAFTKTLTAAGAPPFTWELVGGELPPGVGWNAATATLSGTPTTGGTWFPRFRVTDAYTSGEATLSVTVAEPLSRIDLADAEAQRVDVSADGAVITFDTRKSLDPADTDGASDVYVFDRAAGRLTLLSIGSATGAEASDPTVSDDGRYVAYRQSVTVVPGHIRAIVLYDRLTGTSEAISFGATCADPSEPGVPAAHADLCAALLPELSPFVIDPREPVISGDGEHVAYVVDSPTSGPQVLVWDAGSGTTRIASMAHDGSPDPFTSCDDGTPYLGTGSTDPSLSYDGSAITFTTRCGVGYVVYLDLTTGDVRQVAAGEGVVSGDGRYVVYVDANPGDWGRPSRYDVTTRAREEFVDDYVRDPAVNHDGSVITYQSVSEKIYRVIPGAVPGLATPELVSVPVDGDGPDGPSQHVAISADGRTIVFSSLAGDLSTGDANGLWDVFAFDDRP